LYYELIVQSYEKICKYATFLVILQRICTKRQILKRYKRSNKDKIMKKVFLLGFLALSMVAMAQQVTPVNVTIAELKIDSLRDAYLTQPPMYRTALEMQAKALEQSRKELDAAKATLKAEQKHAKEMGVALKDATKMATNLKKLYAKEQTELKAMQKNIEKQQKTLSKQGDLNEESRTAYRRLLDREQRELGDALDEVSARINSMSELENTLQNEQSRLQAFNTEVAQKALDIQQLEATYKERLATLKAEQKAAKSLQ
jgi:DNA repair exonuclease SbcCD ATPase subunit